MADRMEFLNHLAKRLERDIRLNPDPMPTPVNLYPENRLTDLSSDELFELFLMRSEQTGNKNFMTPSSLLIETVNDVCQIYGSPIMLADLSGHKLPNLSTELQKYYSVSIQTPSSGIENTKISQQAKIGVVFADYGIAESGGVVLFSSPTQARCISLLPETTVFILRKSLILPSVAQLALQLNAFSEHGDNLPSCVNIISGPSCTSDIELIKVTGVHGPVNSICLIITDE
ncbi:lactate utilization protein C [Hafnia sp. HMSC23F03]|uniref:LutC/YkgG family protein n=1 Tax=Hafnia sp. HMSC23F03 TaxID=1581059 RepID=UPI0008A505F9|nr:lactate utilization protein C [Hafnia sp. HMSC23F03]OFS10547.1 hypothetical protein HMPREF3091_09810 [Hafnia sp. HMSC23F03]